MGRTLVLGDIHGGSKALNQVLDRCNFDRWNDRLIFLGDVADGWPETRECIDTLLTIPSLIHLLGNHDKWFLDAVKSGYLESIWTSQGGMETLASYGGSLLLVPDAHIKYLETAKCWHEEHGRMFVHGGWRFSLFDHPKDDYDANLNWDRDLWYAARDRQDNVCYREVNDQAPKITGWHEVYVGHTSTYSDQTPEPLNCCEVWNLDTGAGLEGVLSIMDVDTKEVWQSDLVSTLYPGAKGRRR